MVKGHCSYNFSKKNSTTLQYHDIKIYKEIQKIQQKIKKIINKVKL